MNNTQSISIVGMIMLCGLFCILMSYGWSNLIILRSLNIFNFIGMMLMAGVMIYIGGKLNDKSV